MKVDKTFELHIKCKLARWIVLLGQSGHNTKGQVREEMKQFLASLENKKEKEERVHEAN